MNTCPASDLASNAIHYRLTLFDLSGHLLRVQMTVPQPASKGQRLRLPAWIPGSYLLRDFARHVLTLHAESTGQPVPVRKTDSHTWQCAPCTGPLTVTYTIYAWDLSVRGAHVDESHAFFNGTSVFLQAVGQENRPCLLDIEPPPQAASPGTPSLQNWKVYTSLPPAREQAPSPQGGDAEEQRLHGGLDGDGLDNGLISGFTTYLAPDYDALIDHPVEMGTPVSMRFTVNGAVHELVITGRVPKLDLPRLARDVGKICATQIAFFEPDEASCAAAPFLDSAQKYVFLVMVTEDGYGGLEHRASAALMTSRRSLPVLGYAETTADYQTFLGLVSHEYFHTWHVKRIKPAAFAPYDLQRENHTRLLWVFEGFAAYYDDLMVLRSGLMSPQDYLKTLAHTITTVQAGSGRLKQSVADSSFDAWTRFYKQDENAANAIVSYYTKGSLLALALDLLIRQQSGNRRSLDDVMRLLWQRYGKHFYRGQPQGVMENAMPALITAATGINVADFIARYADGCEDLPLAALLAAQGIQLRWQSGPDMTGSDMAGPDSITNRLNVRLRRQPGSAHATVLAAVAQGGAAHRAGLSAGDVLVALDGLRITDEDSLKHLLASYQPHDTVTLHVFRCDELRRFDLMLPEPALEQCVLSRCESQ